MSSPLGEYIRRQRELSELSMRQFAGLVGISNPYLSQIERGLREPSRDVLDAIAASLEVSADALYEQAGGRPEGDESAEERPVLAAIPVYARPTGRLRQAPLELFAALIGAKLGRAHA